MDPVDREFLARVAHDVRAPLTSIKGYVGLLLEGAFGDLTQEQIQILGLVMNNADRIEALVIEIGDRVEPPEE
ncbi:MAG TPA: histidine kinase dimerization/phospho-acceptor domain-containing protein [Dehalococcoidia bacterium]|nr:histidine kinase dimerization/phospho-acceptor domain-containing protein [Dehalococcoidia bacterium]